jgi:hypothetical protein
MVNEPRLLKRRRDKNGEEHEGLVWKREKE